jgi:hypothetical protein
VDVELAGQTEVPGEDHPQRHFVHYRSQMTEPGPMVLITCDMNWLGWVPGYRPTDPGFDYRRYQVFSELVGLERGLFNLVRIIGLDE